MKITNKYGLPEALVRAIQRDPYDKGAADFSATELLKPPQVRRLTQIHEAELEEDASDRFWALLGKAVHNVLEEHNVEAHIAEERLFRDIEVDGVVYTISGAMDVQVPPEDEGGVRRIMDWKVTSTFKLTFGDDDDWTKQLNIYQWLVGTECELVIVPILRDWKKSQTKKQGYPIAPVVYHPIKAMPLDEVEAMIVDLIREHVAEEVRPCTKEETWKGVRCSDWCPPSRFCPQYQAVLDDPFA